MEFDRSETAIVSVVNQRKSEFLGPIRVQGAFCIIVIIAPQAFLEPIVTFLQGFALQPAAEPARSAQECRKACGTA